MSKSAVVPLDYNPVKVHLLKSGLIYDKIIILLLVIVILVALLYMIVKGVA